MLSLLLMMGVGQMWGTTWTVTGDEAITGFDWGGAHEENDMTQLVAESPWYGLLKTDLELAATTYYFKVNKDHAWDESYPKDNYWVTVSEAGTYNIIYSYYNSTGNAVLAIPYKVWRAAGDEPVFGSNWSTTDVNNVLTKTGDWTYSITKENVLLDDETTYKFKIIADETWSYQYPGVSTNKEFTVSNDGYYDVTVTFNILSKDITVTTTLKHYLVGFGPSGHEWERGEYNPHFHNDSLTINLTEGTTYSFKILESNDTWRGNNATNWTTESGYRIMTADGSGNSSIQAPETGKYLFCYNSSTNKLTIIYPSDQPKAKLTKNTIIYFDGSAEGAVWKENSYTTRFWFKDYITEANVVDPGLDCSYNTLGTDYIYYTTIPDDDNLGRVQLDRKNPANLSGDSWNTSAVVYAFSRSDSRENCLVAPTSVEWSGMIPTWTTYCPPKKTATLTDNSTVTYGGDGNKATPYLVEKEGTIRLQAHTTNYINDANMTPMFLFFDAATQKADRTDSAYSYTASASADIVHKMVVKPYNTYNSVNSIQTLKSDTLYYKTVTCYTVTYYGNGKESGDVPAESGTKYVAGTNVTLATNTGSLAKDGYFLNGWNTAAEGNGTHYDLGATLSSIGANTDLYAEWLPIHYSFAVTETPGSDKQINTVGEIIKSSTGGVMKLTAGKLYYRSANRYLGFDATAESKVTVYLAKDMQEGTVISATIYNTGDDVRGLILCTSDGTQKVHWNSNAGAGTIHTYKYTVSADDGLDGSNKFIIKYNGYVADLVTLLVANCGSDHTYTVTLKHGETPYSTVTALMGSNTLTGDMVHPTSPGRKFQAWEIEGDGAWLLSDMGQLRGDVSTDGTRYTEASTCNWVYDGDLTVKPNWGATSYICGTRKEGEEEINGEFGGWTPGEPQTFTIDGDKGTLDIELTGDRWYSIAVKEYEGTSTYHRTCGENQITKTNTTQVLDQLTSAFAFQTDKTGLYHFEYTFSTNSLTVKYPLYKVTYGKGEGGSADPTTDPETTNGGYYYEGYKFNLWAKDANPGYDSIGIFPNADAMWGRWATTADLNGDRYKYYEATVPNYDYNLYVCYEKKNHIHFIAGDGTDRTKWNSVNNWSRGRLPLATDTVTTSEPVVVDVDHAVAKAIVLTTYGENSYNGSITIQANKGLEVVGTIKKEVDEGLVATSPSDLILESDASGNATLIFDNSNSDQATVQMYSKGWTTGEQGGGTWNWQLIGSPVTDATRLNDYYGGYMYEWSSGWVDMTNTEKALTPFAGYSATYPTTSDALHTYAIDGTLVPTGDKYISIPANTAIQAVANSWTAPIYVKNITFTNCEPANIYIYNTGYGTATKDNNVANRFAPGTYHAVPVNASPYTGDSLIASMQGFYVRNKLGTAGTMTINYSSVVRPTGDRNVNAGQMHAPQRLMEAEPTVLKIYVSDTEHDDRVVLLERNDFSRDFDNGWDGEKFQVNAVKTAPRLFAINETGGKEAVSAIPQMENTVIGFRPGTETEYRISFEYNGAKTLYLYDTTTGSTTLIANENEYAFTSNGTNEDARFIIKSPSDATGVDNLSGTMPQARKVMINGILYIERAGRVYTIEGTLAK